jgi:hypothetical protein
MNIMSLFDEYHLSLSDEYRLSFPTATTMHMWAGHSAGTIYTTGSK